MDFRLVMLSSKKIKIKIKNIKKYKKKSKKRLFVHYIHVVST